MAGIGHPTMIGPGVGRNTARTLGVDWQDSAQKNNPSESRRLTGFRFVLDRDVAWLYRVEVRAEALLERVGRPLTGGRRGRNAEKSGG